MLLLCELGWEPGSSQRAHPFSNAPNQALGKQAVQVYAAADHSSLASIDLKLQELQSILGYKAYMAFMFL